MNKNIIPAIDIFVKHLPSAIRNGLPREIAVVAVSVRKSLALNRQYRKKDKAANVLSFYYAKEYGEIIICPAIIRAEAKKAKHTFQHQMTWYILHGMIHLSGLHHERSSAAARKTEVLERKILATIFNESQHHRLA